MSVSPRQDFHTFYENQYQDQGAALIEWLRFCSAEKVKSVEVCTEGIPVVDILEIGCGTGAILERMDSIGFGEKYWGIDLSHEAIEFVKTLGIKRLQNAVQMDVNHIHDIFPGKMFDLVLLSHVIEHVPEPGEVIKAAGRCGKHVFIEVPLEATPGLNLKGILLQMFGTPRENNISGHIQFYSRKSFHQFLNGLGARVIRSRQYVPLSEKMLDMLGKSPLKRRIILALHMLLGDRV
ncbi:MAG: class I SAM-dependent methyltransferase, partial [Bacteroidota bacterium]